MSYLFHGQRKDEEVILLTHQHPFILLHPFLISGALLLVPFAANIVLNFGSTFAVILLISVVLALVHGVMAWYSWQNSILLLTSERVVMLQQKHLLHREFAECGLGSIQQVSHEIKGLYHTLFGYGHIHIYTGGAQAPFVIPNVPNPYDIQQEILRVSVGEGFEES